MLIKQIKSICRTYGITPQRSKGQNFLISEEVIAEIVEAANLESSDTVLEVGPGLGILTEALIRKVKKVVSVEVDQKLFSFLVAKFAGIKNLELVNEDILKTRNLELKTQNYKIVANIPYNITSIFLRRFLSNEPKPSSMVLLIQKEVGERICALPGKMSLLSLSVQFYGQPEIVGVVDKEKFWPQPQVDSAILKISAIKSQKEIVQWLGEISEKEFWQLVKIGFSARRKQLAHNLAAGLRISGQPLKLALKKAGFDPKIRAQNLSVNDWLHLAKNLKIYLNKS